MSNIWILVQELTRHAVSDTRPSSNEENLVVLLDVHGVPVRPFDRHEDLSATVRRRAEVLGEHTGHAIASAADEDHVVDLARVVDRGCRGDVADREGVGLAVDEGRALEDGIPD